MKIIRRDSLPIRLLFLWLCLGPVLTTAQTKPAAEDARQAAKVDAYVKERMKALNIPGLSLVVLRDGRIVLAKGYGKANLNPETPATEKTSYALYSITKTFTAVATMMLVEEGKVSLEDPISKRLAGLPEAWRGVTVRHILTHTSGLPNWRDYASKLRDMESDYTKAEVLNLVAGLPLTSAPGERWNYVETGFFLLGMMIEKISGKTFEQFLRERIFVPLGMSDTRLDSRTDVIPNRAVGYEWRDGGYRTAVWYSPTLTFSTAGLVSTVLDMAKWDAALYTEKLLKKSTLEQMWANPKLNNGGLVTETGLGFGLSPFTKNNRVHRRVGHVGGAEGFATAMSRFVDDKVTVVVLSNAGQQGFTISGVANEIASFYFRQ
jgi:CubicO group peptidase (beta-lactamase class C family)